VLACGFQHGGSSIGDGMHSLFLDLVLIQMEIHNYPTLSFIVTIPSLTG
jgi:hypothetical protein